MQFVHGVVFMPNLRSLIGITAQDNFLCAVAQFHGDATHFCEMTDDLFRQDATRMETLSRLNGASPKSKARVSHLEKRDSLTRPHCPGVAPGRGVSFLVSQRVSQILDVGGR